ncbi:MAG TPA: tyrosine-type recombinase/integrase [Candidatus Limnocylindrales bacterium]
MNGSEVLGRSGYTLRSYRLGLTDFTGWLANEGVALAEVQRRHVEAYVAKSAVGRAATAVNHRLSVLASFFAFLIRRDSEVGEGAWAGRISPVPAQPDAEAVLHRMAGRDALVRRGRAELRRRAPRRLPREVDPDVAELLVREAGSWRDRAILLLLMRAGQRVGDWHPEHGRHGVLGMRLADFDGRRSAITVRLKGARDEHRVPVTGDFWPVFDRYLAEERGDPPTDAAWVGHRRGAGKPLRYSAFEAALRYLGDRLGVRVTPHMFRHGLAQQVYETSGVKVAQEILGHRHVSTTADAYAHVDQQAMVTALAGVEARRRAQLAIPAEQIVAGQRYAFAYDPSTIVELEAVAGCHIVEEASDD